MVSVVCHGYGFLNSSWPHHKHHMVQLDWHCPSILCFCLRGEPADHHKPPEGWMQLTHPCFLTLAKPNKLCVPKEPTFKVWIGILKVIYRTGRRCKVQKYNESLPARVQTWKHHGGKTQNWPVEIGANILYVARDEVVHANHGILLW